MSKEIYQLGYSTGMQEASKSAREILSAEKDMIPNICGRKLNQLKENDGLKKVDNFTVGFFDGFLHRAEELRI